MGVWIRVPLAGAGHVRRNEVQSQAYSPEACPAPQRGQPDESPHVHGTLAASHQRRHAVDKRQGGPIPAIASSARRAGAKLRSGVPATVAIRG
jgi:hypothetical protein